MRRRFGLMAPPKAALAAKKMFNTAEGAVWRHEIYRSRRILAALAADKVFNGADGSIRRQKTYGSYRKVDVRMPETLWMPIKAAIGYSKKYSSLPKIVLIHSWRRFEKLTPLKKKFFAPCLQ